MSLRISHQKIYRRVSCKPSMFGFGSFSRYSVTKRYENISKIFIIYTSPTLSFKARKFHFKNKTRMLILKNLHICRYVENNPFNLPRIDKAVLANKGKSQVSCFSFKAQIVYLSFIRKKKLYKKLFVIFSF